ncbi:alpha-1,4-digalacturonate transport system permease protein [Microbacterium terrae]|uniref:L-arabinose transport system permease protein AraQ n=1 Tax=Microbacterium terrae TaxID=69369 RepID=A0A0M2H4G3_9MICO|nr:carbohydrate ABC transporter permease [Microbacterium terrae]KJL38622.1 L-arabinose transport system permease protein AraQ [Microbacterium terrae]MBP1076040.1 alpha-1,4-digalacturonate transport system permease protein [Microbacterium terrae]GLJ96860.1 sugar ABC transporter permease [Microbacterium terrae]
MTLTSVPPTTEAVVASAPAQVDTAPAPGRRRVPWRVRFTRSALPTAAMWILAALFLVPILWLILSSLKPAGELFTFPLSVFPENPTLENYAGAWEKIDFARYVGNTALVATVTTALTVFVSACTGYALAKYQSWVLRALFICFLATTMLPTEVILSPSFIVVRNLGLYDTLAGVIVPSIITATGIFMFRQFFMTVPDELIDAARMDGARELTIFFRIMLPLASPILVTLAIFSFQWRWNDYVWPLIVLNSPELFTLQTALRSLVGAENIQWSLLLAASVISILPLLVIFLIFQKYIVSADLNAGLKD